MQPGAESSSHKAAEPQNLGSEREKESEREHLRLLLLLTCTLRMVR